MRLGLCLMVMLLVEGCAERIQKAGPDSNQSQPVTVQSSVQTKPEAKGFQPVQEMLSHNCAPCHNPGGKMYERLPFDSPEVVRSHSTPILGRLKKPEDKRILEDWLSEPQL